MIYKNIRNNKIYLVSEMDSVTRNINITRVSQLGKKFVIMGLYNGSVFFLKRLEITKRFLEFSSYVVKIIKFLLLKN